MKVCETCGKVLKDSTEEYTINKIMQCYECAYGKETKNTVPAASPAKKQKPIIKYKETAYDRQNRGWLSFFEFLAVIMLLTNWIISITFAVILYECIYGFSGGLATFVAILGIVISVVLYGFVSVILNAARDISMIRKNIEIQTLKMKRDFEIIQES